MQNNYNGLSTFQKSIGYKEIEKKESESGRKAERIGKFLLEKEEGEQDENKGQKRYKLSDKVGKKKKEEVKQEGQK